MSDNDFLRFRDRAREVLARVRFPKFRFVVRGIGVTDTFLQIECAGTCNVTDEDLEWKGRKWLLSRHMTDGEIVQTAFKAVLTALEHEAREQFSYRGACIFDPHYDIERLVELRCSPGALKERSPA